MIWFVYFVIQEESFVIQFVIQEESLFCHSGGNFYALNWTVKSFLLNDKGFLLNDKSFLLNDKKGIPPK
jgi:hypothetical protein